MEEKQDIKFYKNTIDLTGKRFGKLVVIELNHKTQKTLANGNKKSNYYWKCKCDCGKEVIKSGDSLRRGHTKSCGCIRIKKKTIKEESKLKRDLTGRRFSKLIVIELEKKYTVVSAKGNKRTVTYWKCKCDCGKEVVKSGYALRHGISKSCGCTRTNNINRKIPNLIGKRFNKLVVKEFVNSELVVSEKGRKRIVTYWKCKCDCGKEVIAKGYNLIRESTKSCGCEIERKKVKNYWLSNYNKEIALKEKTNINLLNSKLRKNNKTGVRGVSFVKAKNKYISKITLKGHTYCLGYYDNIEDAKEARQKAEKKYYNPILEKYGYKTIENEEEFE